MIPTEGLIGSFRGQMVIVAVLLVLGAIVCTGLTLAIMVRKAPPLTTQVDLVTGKKEHGIGSWWLFFASFTVGPALLFGLVRTLIEAVNRLNAAVPYWWVAVLLVAALVAVFVGWWKLQRRQPQQRQDFPEAPQPVAVVEPAVGWSLPDGVGQWDEFYQAKER